jgi:hypothetical protein
MLANIPELLKDDGGKIRVFRFTHKCESTALNFETVKNINIISIQQHQPARLLGIGNFSYPQSLSTVLVVGSANALGKSLNSHFPETKCKLNCISLF